MQGEGASEVAEGVEEIVQLHLLEQLAETLMGPLAGGYLKPVVDDVGEGEVLMLEWRRMVVLVHCRGQPRA